VEHDVAAVSRFPDCPPESRWAREVHWPASCRSRRAATRLRQGSWRCKTLISHYIRHRNVRPCASLGQPAGEAPRCRSPPVKLRAALWGWAGWARRCDLSITTFCAHSVHILRNVCQPDASASVGDTRCYDGQLQSTERPACAASGTAVLGPSGRVSWQMVSVRAYWCPAVAGRVRCCSLKCCCSPISI
jgi:hypothetical protein